MRILITGADGFLGRHMVSSLAEEHEVLAVTRRSDPAPWPGISWVQADLSKDDFRCQLPNSIDAVLALAQSRHYREFPQEVNDVFQVNVRSLLQLLEWARDCKAQKFVYASSANVYEMSDKVIDESHTLQPTSFYARSKLMGEQLVESYADFFPCYVLRLFTPYGPQQRGMLIPQLIDRVLTGQTVTLEGKEGLRLSPIFVEDTCEVTRAVLNERSSSTAYTLLNVGGQEIAGIRNLTQLMGQILDKPVNYLTVSDVDPKGWIADSSKLLNRFHLPTFKSLKQGLRSTINERLANV